MVDYYKGVQQSTANFRQAQIGNAPVQDSAARQKAQNVARSIDMVNNIGMGLIQQEDKRIQAKNINEARRKTADMPQYINSFVREKAAKDGKELRNLSTDQIDIYSREASSKFYEDRGITGSNYFAEAQEIGADLSTRTYVGLVDQRNNEDLEYNKNLISERVGFQADTLERGGVSADNFLSILKSDLTIDSDAVTVLSQEERAASEIGDVATAKEAQLSGLISYASTNGSPQLVEVLKSKEAKEYFGGVPNYSNMVSMAEQKSVSTINSTRAANFQDIEQNAYGIMSLNGFKTKTDVDSFIKEYKGKYTGLYAPKEEDIFNLRAKMYKSVSEATSLSDYRASIQKGDNTWLKSSGLTEKEQEALITQNAQVEIGVSDFTPASIDLILADKEKSLSFRQYISSGKPVPEQLRTWATETPLGGWKGIQKKYADYQQLSALSEGRINEIFNKKSQMEMLFTGRLIDKEMTTAEKNDAFIAFQNDINKSVDSFGNYYSPVASDTLRDPDVIKNIAKFSKDAPWTWDENTDSDYIARNVKGNVGLYVAAGYTPEQSLDKAKELFQKSHKYIELPDGSEGIITPSFVEKGLEKEDFEFFVNNHNEVRKIKRAAFASGTTVGDFLFERRLTYRPVAEHEKTGEYHIFYNGTKINNTRFNAKQMADYISIARANERSLIEINRPQNKEK